MKNEKTGISKESEIIIRIANYADAKQLADIHFLCSSMQPGGFMHLLGIHFFKQYYKILLKEPSSVIVCADAGSDGIVGIASGTLEARKEIQALNEGRYRLLCSSLPALIRKPRLIKDVYIRSKFLAGSATDKAYLINEGPRSSFWGYLPNHYSNGMAIRLLKTFLNIMEDLGASYVRFEVDQINTKVEKINKMLGAEIVKEFPMRDKRVRAIWIHRLNPNCRRQFKVKSCKAIR